jgi:hypothetical protein
MFFSISKWGIISFILIFLIHHLYLFLINTLTVPKIKDLVNKPNEVYKDMFLNLHAKANPIMATNNTMSTNNTLVNDTTAMANELNSFLNDLKKTTPQDEVFATSSDKNNYTNY